MQAVSWPVVGSFAAGVANLAFLWYLWDFREKPGARWFFAVIVGQVVLCFSQGVAMLVFDPLWLREALEALFWLAGSVVVVGYLGFAAAYTGRGHLVETWWFRAVALFGLGFDLLVVTNPWHHLVWQNFRLDPIYGAATVSYVHSPLIRLQFVGIVLVSVVGMALLLDTVISFGPLYRKQAAAVALTPIPPIAAFTVWTFDLGPAPQLNLVPIMFLPHIALDTYALFRSDMFEFSPTTRRTGERAALDDLGSPIIVVDEKGRIVTLNAPAEAALGVDKRAALTDRLVDYLGVDDLDLAASDQSLTLTQEGSYATYKLVTSPLRDVAGTHVGYTVLLQDVTDEIRRKQRLTVLNRVLRHNLRNDLTVVQGYLQGAADLVDDDEVRWMLETAEDETRGLIELGEKARTIEQTMGGDVRSREPVPMADLLAALGDRLEAEFEDGRVTVAVPGAFQLETNRELVEVVFANLVENGLEHDDGTDPHVTVTLVAVEDDGTAVFTVADEGPGIPEHERQVIDAGEETALAHGSGLGLWLVNWTVSALGGSVSFETGGGDDESEGSSGTTVLVRLPGAVPESVERPLPQASP
ncbi:histidine kinase N-terminal 7TM domain-containing protein [Haloarchaeobius sp. DYHT-AS-18]|uniref:histidine kinase N-terminal 7TM domain-containing protein n=1 Tax=Haloarchaeobius sp. DYHT-AS-18 TaxID=3446117 RepID=UPI003EBAE69D